MTPFRCFVVPPTSKWMAPFGSTVPGWQPLQFGNATPACAGVEGGVPWHDPQNAWELPSVHTGARSLALVSPAIDPPPPWQ